MKTILVATDFSQEGNKMIDFALRIARKIRAEVILFHAYPYPADQHHIIKNAGSLLRKDAEAGLEILLKRIQQDPENSNLFVWTLCVKGDFASQLYHTTQEIDIDLVIVGIAGKNRLSYNPIHRLIQKHSQTIARCLVLFVPDSLHEKQIRTMSFAVKDEVHTISTLNKLTKLAGFFNAKIQLINSLGKGSYSSEVELEQGLQQVKHIRLRVHPSGNAAAQGIPAPETKQVQAEILGIITYESERQNNSFSDGPCLSMSYQHQIPLLVLDHSYIITHY